MNELLVEISSVKKSNLSIKQRISEQDPRPSDQELEPIEVEHLKIQLLS